ncbi:aminotransferase class III-fold pyridoxal phosphate-dependent enzyme [Epidermidibacterium keratini]|uniref:Aminotransferase class III-fold pyridoxal phosphate-dependent enzyme n=1 Tax=Epidermidibacterium keratini TaxID=1891644 RepID=A0A7L4YNB6_9ACTN|nr:aminotransferase class III-fold pyridoxal phosphate-dependent enzyme [Epidermidibacterium keratini]QHC00640.1 aminotransferase class III-fold pyridoxal phosphate-dependent enzyme [Epidermidibacterium keratini]
METAFWHPQALMSQVKNDEIVLERGEGSHVWTDDGRKLFDATAGLWYANIGHGDQRITDAVVRQMNQLETFHAFGNFATPITKALCERIVSLAPLGDDAKVFLASGGSDAIDTAAKLARRYFTAAGEPNRRILVSREYGYHGLHGFGTSLGWLQPNREGYGELDPDIIRASATDADEVEKLFMNTGPELIAAFFCEPIIGAGGAIFPGEEYLSKVRELCRQHGILFIADEVITGFGRTGPWFASERFDLQPDMITFAKGVTSGYLPVGGVVISQRVCEPFWADGSNEWFKHGMTYSGHSTCAAAAMANLDVIEADGLLDRVRELEPKLDEALQSLADHPNVAEIRSGTGLVGAVVVDTAEAGQGLYEGLMANGVISRKLGDGRALQYSPPFVMTDDELAWLTEQTRAALDTL